MKTHPLKYTLTIIATILLTTAMTVFAAPFTPGQTLDPGCNPGDVDCYVVGSDTTFADTDLVFTGDRTHNQDGNDLHITNGNFSYQNAADFLGLGLAGTGLAYFEPLIETSLIGIFDSGAPGRFPTMYYTYDDGVGNTIERGVYMGDVSITLSNNETTPTDNYSADIVNAAEAIILRTQNNTSGEENRIQIDDSTDGISFSSDVGSYIFPRNSGVVGQVMQKNISQMEWVNAAAGTLPAYADDVAAGVGGLSAGQYYQTDGSGAAPLSVPGIVMIKQ